MSSPIDLIESSVQELLQLAIQAIVAERRRHGQTRNSLAAAQKRIEELHVQLLEAIQSASVASAQEIQSLQQQLQSVISEREAAESQAAIDAAQKQVFAEALASLQDRVQAEEDEAENRIESLVRAISAATNIFTTSSIDTDFEVQAALDQKPPVYVLPGNTYFQLDENTEENAVWFNANTNTFTRRGFLSAAFSTGSTIVGTNDRDVPQTYWEGDYDRWEQIGEQQYSVYKSSYQQNPDIPTVEAFPLPASDATT